MKYKDILVKNPFGNHTMLSNLVSNYNRIQKSNDKTVTEIGPGSTEMIREDWLKEAEKVIKKFNPKLK